MEVGVQEKVHEGEDGSVGAEKRGYVLVEIVWGGCCEMGTASKGEGRG